MPPRMGVYIRVWSTSFYPLSIGNELSPQGKKRSLISVSRQGYI